MQRHPFKNAILHVDFQRVEENEKIRISIPLHFKGEAVSPGVKSQGGIVSHMRNEVEVSCLPKDLPEFIEVDLSGLSLNESIHLSQLKIPEGVQLVDLAKEDSAVVAIHSPRAEEPEPTAAAAAAARRLRKARRSGSGARRRRRGRCGQDGGAREGGRQEGTGEERREEVIDASDTRGRPHTAALLFSLSQSDLQHSG